MKKSSFSAATEELEIDWWTIPDEQRRISDEMLDWITPEAKQIFQDDYLEEMTKENMPPASKRPKKTEMLLLRPPYLSRNFPRDSFPLTLGQIQLEKHLQCEKLLGLARGTTKKRGNKKSNESITPIRYNVIHMYTGSFPYFPGQSTQFLLVG